MSHWKWHPSNLEGALSALADCLAISGTPKKKGKKKKNHQILLLRTTPQIVRAADYGGFNQCLALSSPQSAQPSLCKSFNA